ncbi:DUF5666 domain-containing protein [Iodobacter fluviatilis]|uniref:DUF5666 domain-containing protein n=1 Tax=Iodobacter fluviatilis TaxID=537 RepID=A0A377QAA2_9NEIS|nr:DUF5666 domain-containing protein [Iodobacter fluviatilis]TCU81948.1 hypothetical protein EV682_11870 [Iodobacter fluviatilis]STQ91519.1 Uncharacterised protein [Iodobacter fluviatilis]
MDQRLKMLALALVVSVGLYACGGGSSGSSSGTTPVATNPTSLPTTVPTAVPTPTPAPSGGAYAQGTVTGFGSVIVDGVTLDDSSASFKVEQDPSVSSTGTSNDIKLGMKVESDQGSDDKIKTLTALPEVYGKITELVVGTGFKLAGQTVRVSTDAAAPTVFEGASVLADLLVGDIVEVHGSRDATGVIVATRIERKDPASTVMVRVVGVVSALDNTAKTLVVSGLTVNFSGAKLRPDGVVLENGQLVAAWSDQAISAASVMTAKALKVKKPQAGDGLKMQIGGLIAGLDAKALSFKLGEVVVDASKAKFESGVVVDLANGKAVRVGGVWQTDKLVAAGVKFVKDSADAKVSLSGVVTDYISLASFKVRGALVDGSAATFDGGAASNLANGVQVKIEGSVSNGKVQAKTVKIDTPVATTPPPNASAPTNASQTASAGVRTITGEVKDYDSKTGKFTLSGVKLNLQINDKTEYGTIGSDVVTSKSDFINGAKVLVRGEMQADVLVVKEVRFPPKVEPPVKLGGVISSVTASQFKLNGVTILWSATTPVDGGKTADVVNGVNVNVTVLKNGDKLQAQQIEIKGRVATTLEVKGAVSDFVLLSNFKVAGQKVDASKAEIKEGKSGSLANGRVVNVKGVLTNGVLMASQVSFAD